MTVETADHAIEYGRGLLVGERVRLRALREDDLPLLESWWEDPGQQPLQRFAVRPAPAGAGAALLRDWSANRDASAVGFCVESLDGGDLLGHVTVNGVQLPERAGRLAIQIGPPHVGRGFGTDAVRTAVRYGFLAMGLNRIQLETFTFNDRARRAYAQAGFIEEGVRREVLWIDGGFADEVIMAILRRDWRP